MEEERSVLLFRFMLFCERWQKFKLFWFFVPACSADRSALRVGKKPKVLKCAVGSRLAANGCAMLRSALILHIFLVTNILN